jgi:hypothetical protein
MSKSDAGKGDKPRNCFTRQFKENHESNSYKELLTVNGKEVSFDLLYNIIGKRFH